MTNKGLEARMDRIAAQMRQGDLPVPKRRFRVSSLELMIIGCGYIPDGDPLRNRLAAARLRLAYEAVVRGGVYSE